jgi:hypothetical protein
MKNNWWITFALLLLLGILSYQFAMLAYYPSILLGYLTRLNSSGAADIGVLMGFMMISFSLGYLCSQLLTNTTIVMKYYDLVAQKDTAHWDERIERLGLQQATTFENEGEF